MPRETNRTISQITNTVQIDAPPEKIWELLIDVNRYPEWVVPSLRILEPPVGEMGLGATYREHGGIGPLKSEST